LRVRLTEEEHDRLQELADLHTHGDMSEYTRMRLFEN